MRALVIGGTGTLGGEMIRRLLDDTQYEVTCFSRCELKQKELREKFKSHPRLRFHLGDIRDYDSILKATIGQDVVFHFAALKHVDTGEFHPEEFIKTNVTGTNNAAEAAIQCGVSHFVFSSTDKAVDPINAYGYSKALAEKILTRKSETQSKTNFVTYRWGNVINSRGSAIPLFINSIKSGDTINLTSKEMSRFWIKIEDAVQFVLDTYRAPSSQTMLPPIKAASLLRVISTLSEVIGKDPKTKITGLRRGEKIHEVLRSQHEDIHCSSDKCAQYTDKELRGLLAPLVGNS